MCMIIVKPKGVALPSSALLSKIARHNSHGFGFVLSDGTSYKTLDKNHFIERLAAIDSSKSAIIHFRLATRGEKKTDNCHPFKYGKVWMAHNGTMSINPRDGMTDSETFLIDYVGFYLDHICDNIITKTFTSYLNHLDGVINGGRLAFLENGRVKCYGNWYRYAGCLFSNTIGLPTYESVS